MALSEEENRFYQQTLQMARRQLEEIDQKIEDELAGVRDRLAALQSKRKAAWQMYDAACTMLGIQNDLALEESADVESI
jgi:hypothetical protein